MIKYNICTKGGYQMKKLLKRIFKPNYASDIGIRRMDAENFQIMSFLNNGKESADIIPYHGRGKFILDLCSIEKRGYLTEFSDVKITKEDSQKILNVIAESFPHYADMKKPRNIFEKEDLAIRLNECNLIFEKRNLETMHAYELEMNMDLTNVIQLFADCINFAHSTAADPILYMETEQEMNEYSEDGELDDYELGYSQIEVNKNDMTFKLIHSSKKDTNSEEICILSIVELSKILQQIRIYKDQIVDEINKGFISWD